LVLGTTRSPLFASLDGDGIPDWCVVGDAGPACTLARERTLTTEAMPWGYAQGGAFEASTGAVALGDVDGDGRADLCAIVGDAVQCAIAQDRAFGPRSTWLDAPGARSLLLGDLDGDSKADPCVDTGGAVVCAPSP